MTDKKHDKNGDKKDDKKALESSLGIRDAHGVTWSTEPPGYSKKEVTNNVKADK